MRLGESARFSWGYKEVVPGGGFAVSSLTKIISTESSRGS